MNYGELTGKNGIDYGALQMHRTAGSRHGPERRSEPLGPVGLSYSVLQCPEKQPPAEMIFVWSLIHSTSIY